MNAEPSRDPSFDPAAISDDALLSEHERLVGPQPDDRAHYRFLPLVTLLVLSSGVLFAATYLNRYSGHFDSKIFDENELPSSATAAAAPIDPVVLGKRLFLTGGACYTCHQPTGLGIPGVYPPLAGSEWAQGPEDRVVRIVLYGLSGPITVESKTFGAAVMPSFGTSGFNWSDEKIAAVLTYVRQEWGNKAPAISPDTVAKIRQEVGTRGAWTSDELSKIK